MHRKTPLICTLSFLAAPSVFAQPKQLQPDGANTGPVVSACAVRNIEQDTNYEYNSGKARSVSTSVGPVISEKRNYSIETQLVELQILSSKSEPGLGRFARVGKATNCN